MQKVHPYRVGELSKIWIILGLVQVQGIDHQLFINIYWIWNTDNGYVNEINDKILWHIFETLLQSSQKLTFKHATMQLIVVCLVFLFELSFVVTCLSVCDDERFRRLELFCRLRLLNLTLTRWAQKLQTSNDNCLVLVVHGTTENFLFSFFQVLAV